MDKLQPKCNSCNSTLANEQGALFFTCPSCEKQQIARCLHCRQISAKYTCSACGFIGPN